MTKNKMWDNSNMQEELEWGNVPVGNLSDEELYNKNWNRVEGVRNFWDSEQGKKQRERYSEISKKANNERLCSEEYRNKISSISRKTALDENRNKKLSNSAKKYWNSEEGKLKRSQQQKENWKNNKDKMALALKERHKDGVIAKKISESLKKSDKLKQATAKQTNQIQTPDGIFNSRKAAAAFYGIDPTAINRRMQKNPDQYFYIKIGNGSTGYKNKKT